MMKHAQNEKRHVARTERVYSFYKPTMIVFCFLLVTMRCQAAKIEANTTSARNLKIVKRNQIKAQGFKDKINLCHYLSSFCTIFLLLAIIVSFDLYNFTLKYVNKIPYLVSSTFLLLKIYQRTSNDSKI